MHHHQHRQQHQHRAVRQQRGCLGIDGAGIQTQCAAGDIQIRDDILHDLAAGQRYDGQIVALQPQGRQTHQKAKQRRRQPAQQHGKGQPHKKRQAAAEGDGQQTAAEQAHGHKACMAQGKLAQQTDHQIQRDGQHDIDRNRKQHIGDLPGQTAAAKQQTHRQKRGGSEREGHKIAHAFALFTFCHSRYTFSLIFLPSRPVGRTTSTSTRTPKTMASAQRVEI